MRSLLQRIVSLETDSGFGSSYLNASASGSLQPHLADRCGLRRAAVCKLFIRIHGGDAKKPKIIPVETPRMVLWVALKVPAPTCKQPSPLNSAPSRLPKLLFVVRLQWSAGWRAPPVLLLSGCQVSIHCRFHQLHAGMFRFTWWSQAALCT